MTTVCLFLLIFIAHLQEYCSGTNYCSVYCQSGSGTHTMCKYPEKGGSACEKYTGRLEAEEKKLILAKHNEMRQKVAVGKQKGQPKASNMMKLEWDDELAMIAQRWSEQCELFEHDQCRTTEKGEVPGQNLAKRTGEINKIKEQVTKMIQSWYDEVNVLSIPNVESYNPDNFMSVGHYTQLAWADTSQVGCGYYSDIWLSHTYIFVCNYLPAGNMMTRPMYKIGKPCTDCPVDTHCSKAYPGLCTKDAYDVGDGVIPDNLFDNGSSKSITPYIHLLTSFLFLNIYVSISSYYLQIQR